MADEPRPLKPRDVQLRQRQIAGLLLLALAVLIVALVRDAPRAICFPAAGGGGRERSRRRATLPLLVVLLGPTASGKTALSLALAERFNGEIVSCDSVAVYRDFEIGTAKPNAAERAQRAASLHRHRFAGARVQRG